MIRSALLLAFTATTLAAQGSFEGSITMSLADKDGKKTEMTYLSKNGKLRVDMPGGRGGAAVIDGATKKMLVMMSAQKMYMEMDMATAQTSATRGGNPPKVVRTGRMETIAGSPCEHIEITGDDGMTDVCGASGMGSFAIPSMGGRGGAPTEAWQRAMGDFFPLKVTKEGKVTVEVTKIERKSLDEALFSVPGDFTKIDMGMMRGRGGH